MVDFDNTDDDLSEQERLFRESGGGHSSLSSVNPEYAPTRGGKKGRCTKQRINTKGRIRSLDGRAWVYVAVAVDGRVKIGMSGNPEVRAYGLRAEMRLCAEVAVEAAQHIETEALRLLGHTAGDGEWTFAPLERALAAVWVARARAAKVMRVDPSLSDDDARRLRIGLAELHFCL